LKANLVSLIRALLNRNEKDVFKSTQNRLTRTYSGLIMLFLIVFIFIVYSVLYVVILKNQEHELQSLVGQESSFIEDYMVKNTDLNGFQNQEVVFAGVDQYFYYAVDQNGKVMMGNEANHRLRQSLLNLVNGRIQNDNEIHKEILHVETGPRGRGEFRPHEMNQDIHLMIASHSIYVKGQYIGRLYIGKDISFAYQLFHWLLLILVMLGIIFFGVAVFISVVMSKRAMVPISGAFTRQREFVADASHELRTPLSVLLSSIDAMEMTIEPEGFVEKMLSNMRQEVKRMTGLVGDLLTLARSDSNANVMKKETFDFRPFAEKAIESVSPLAAEKEISLSMEAPSSLKATGDSQRLSQLLYILLDNAIKYTPRGGEVKLVLKNGGNELWFSVQDTGIGIKKEDFSRIFERFYRVDKSRSRQVGGHGLGLSIAKWIVDTHGGAIQLASEVGKGSTFAVRIPGQVDGDFAKL
jgi:signal transduction histidine kinase